MRTNLPPPVSETRGLGNPARFQPGAPIVCLLGTRRPSLQRRGEKGILLIETLLAVIVLSAGLIVLLQASLSGLRAGAEAGDLYRGSLVAERLAWELEAAGKADNFGGSVEDPVLGAVSWAGKEESVPSQVPGRDPAWNRWDVTVSWKSRGRDNHLTLPVGLPKP